MTGQAIDIDMDHTEVSNKEIFDFIKDNLEFDTLIWELGYESPNWVHVSYREGKNRNQVLQAYKNDNGLTSYRMYEQKKKKVQGNKNRSVSSRKIRSVSDTSRDNT
jgi:NADH dehydrogenase FAD-containing subunit